MTIHIVNSFSLQPFTSSHNVTPLSQSDGARHLLGPESLSLSLSTAARANISSASNLLLSLRPSTHHYPSPLHQHVSIRPATHSPLVTQLAITIKFSFSSAITPDPPPNHRTIARRPRTVAAHCLRLLVLPAVDVTGRLSRAYLPLNRRANRSGPCNALSDPPIRSRSTTTHFHHIFLLHPLSSTRPQHPRQHQPSEISNTTITLE